MAITLRKTKGSPLTHDELDNNFKEVTANKLLIEANSANIVTAKTAIEANKALIDTNTGRVALNSSQIVELRDENIALENKIGLTPQTRKNYSMATFLLQNTPAKYTFLTKGNLMFKLPQGFSFPCVISSQAFHYPASDYDSFISGLIYFDDGGSRHIMEKESNLLFTHMNFIYSPIDMFHLNGEYYFTYATGKLPSRKKWCLSLKVYNSDISFDSATVSTIPHDKDLPDVSNGYKFTIANVGYETRFTAEGIFLFNSATNVNTNISFHSLMPFEIEDNTYRVIYKNQKPYVLDIASGSEFEMVR